MTTILQGLPPTLSIITQGFAETTTWKEDSPYEVLDHTSFSHPEAYFVLIGHFGMHQQIIRFDLEWAKKIPLARKLLIAYLVVFPIGCALLLSGILLLSVGSALPETRSNHDGVTTEQKAGLPLQIVGGFLMGVGFLLASFVSLILFSVRRWTLHDYPGKDSSCMEIGIVLLFITVPFPLHFLGFVLLNTCLRWTPMILMRELRERCQGLPRVLLLMDRRNPQRFLTIVPEAYPRGIVDLSLLKEIMEMDERESLMRGSFMIDFDRGERLYRWLMRGRRRLSDVSFPELWKMCMKNEDPVKSFIAADTSRALQADRIRGGTLDPQSMRPVKVISIAEDCSNDTERRSEIELKDLPSEAVALEPKILETVSSQEFHAMEDRLIIRMDRIDARLDEVLQMLTVVKEGMFDDEESEDS